MDRRDQGKTAGDAQQAVAEEDERAAALAVLPDDVLADILRRLPHRDLAVARCVCEAWRAIVDARRLLRADLLPLSLGGFFINFNNYYISEFFSCPSTAPGTPSISGKRRYFPEAADCRSWGLIRDHCNGLVLVDTFDIWYVLNPATQWVASLPPCPPPPMEKMNTYQNMYLAYDPTMSPDYEVVSVTRLHYTETPLDPEVQQSEWPRSVCTLQVFSSRAGQWEERSFAREGGAVGTVAEMGVGYEERKAVYWRGALYIHCENDFVIRVSLSSDKYQVIIKPAVMGTESYLGKSAKGVYYATVINWRSRVQVWNLVESGCELQWVMIHDRDLSKWLLKHELKYKRPDRCYDQAVPGPWTLQDINYYYDDHYNIAHDMEATVVPEEFEWTSEEALLDEKFTWSSDDEYRYDHGYLEILGFHPCKEIIFLSESITRGLAYHLNSSKVEVLGNLYPAAYHQELGNEQLIMSSFPYTPCCLGQTADENN